MTASPPISTADWDKLTELAARVEAGDGNDTHLNAEIGFALQWEHCDQLDDGFLRRNGYGFPAPFWTSSLDAVVALIAERLPGWGVNLYCGWQWDKASARLAMPSSLRDMDDSNAQPSVSASSPARALLAALLRAIAAQQDRQTEGS